MFVRCVIALIAIIAIVSAADCASGKPPVKSESMFSCKWYKDSNCCPAGKDGDQVNTPAKARTNTVRTTFFPPAQICKSNAPKCVEMYNLATCKSCSPDSVANGQSACKKFADDAWDACKTEKMWDTTDAADPKCSKVADVLADSAALMGQWGLSGAVKDGDTDCFSAGSSTAPSLLTFAAGAVAFQTRSPLALTLFVFALFSLASAKCTGGADGVDAGKVDFQCACAWYKDSTCCPSSYGVQTPTTKSTAGLCARAGAKVFHTCKRISSKCRDAVDFAGCAASCSPKQKEWMPTGQLRICKDQAKSMYDACKGDQFFNSTQYECQDISKQFSDGKSFVESGNSVHGGNWVYVDGTDDCFNSASSIVISVAVAIAVLFGVAF